MYNMDITLIRKYNVAGPRYTSYPTVPYWNLENFSVEEPPRWKESCDTVPAARPAQDRFEPGATP